MLAAVALILAQAGAAMPSGPWRATLDVAGGPLRFGLVFERDRTGTVARVCNGSACDVVRVYARGDSVVLDIADYAASITAARRGDSLVGFYRNVGSRGPRTIPFRASAGRWSVEFPPPWLPGRWDAWFGSDSPTPRVLEFRRAATGLEGTVVSNAGDYGRFWGRAEADSFSLARFDGSFVYMLTGSVRGDTMRGIFHAGLRTQTPFVAVRSSGAPHLIPPSELIRADTAPFRFAFPDLDGRMVTNEDARFRGKVVLVEIVGTWCPTCHDSAPVMSRIYRRYRARGLEMVGLAYEVTGDTAVDGALVRRYRDKFDIRYPLLLAGISDTEAAAATLPQLTGALAFPTLVFLGRDGRVRHVHAGFYGPALGAQHERLVRDIEGRIQRLLDEPR